MLAPLVESLAGPHASIAIRGWDGSRSGPDDAVATIVVQSPDAIRRLLYAPNELGLSRAFVMGELEVEGDLLAALYALRPDGTEVTIGARTLARILRTGSRLGTIGRPLPRPPEESRLRGRIHTKRRDAEAVSHHYD